MRGLLVAVLMGWLVGCSTEIAAGLDEAQSQEALAALGRAGIAGEREAGGSGRSRRYAIHVPSGDASRAAAALRAEGLPRAAEKGLAELYGSPGMIPSATEERARFMKALAGEVATLLERLDPVLDAGVIVTVPVDDPLAPADAPRARPTASVLLKLRPGAQPPAETDVRRLVAGAVEGLEPAAVAIVIEAAGPAPEAAPAFARVGPITVARSSRGVLVGVLAGALALVLAMGGWVLYGERRRRLA